MQTSVLALLLLCGVASAHLGGLFKDLNETQKKELQAILHNQDLTKKQTHEQVRDWVSKQDEKTKKAFEDMEQKKKEWKAKHEARHAEKLKNASPEAKAVDEQISAVWKNEDLTKKQSCEKMNEIVGKASDKVKTELHLETRDCSKPFRPHHGHRGEHHRGNRHGQHKNSEHSESAQA